METGVYMLSSQSEFPPVSGLLVCHNGTFVKHSQQTGNVIVGYDYNRQLQREIGLPVPLFQIRRS